MLADFWLVGGRARPLAVEREPHADMGAPAEPTADFDLAAVQRSQSLHDREPEAGPVVPPIIGRTRLEKRLAQARKIVLADADAGVLDDERNLRALGARAHRHASAA